jgi:exonuclease SbcD
VLRTVRGTLEELEAAAAQTGDAYLRVFVREQPRAGLADDVRALLPGAVDVRIAPDVTSRHGARAASSPAARGSVPRELFRQYLDGIGHAADDRLTALFDELLDAETV